MATTLTIEAKVNSISLSLESKNRNYLTWADHTETWANATGTWQEPGIPMTKENKINALSLTLETRT